jgi:SpoVK/Ycf46/Vps4 family AAA+-type ATPase
LKSSETISDFEECFKKALTAKQFDELRPNLFDNLLHFPSFNPITDLQIEKVNLSKEELDKLVKSLKSSETISDFEECFKKALTAKQFDELRPNLFDKLVGLFSLRVLAEKAKGFSGADIEALCREAAMIALRENLDAKSVKHEHFDAAFESIKPLLAQQKRVTEDRGYS